MKVCELECVCIWLLSWGKDRKANSHCSEAGKVGQSKCNHALNDESALDETL